MTVEHIELLIAPTNTAEIPPIVLLMDALTHGHERVVERMEARGQQEFVASDTLPTEGLLPMATVYGIQLVRPVGDDPLFTFVKLPPGWRRTPHTNILWSDILDASGQVRALVFYKAASYDRRAHIRFLL